MLHLEPLGWTPSTPEGGIEADVVTIRDASPSAIGGASLKRRVVLLGSGASPGGTEAIRAERRREFDAALVKAGALAILVPDPDPDNRLTARVWQFGGEISALPVAEIGREDASLIRQSLARGPVRIAFAYTNRVTSGPVDTPNVIAEIRGREHQDEWVLVSAHLDSWDYATGAQDNATGVAMVIEAARAIVAAGLTPRRSMRFALWGGEEQGILGSAAYARAHTAELERLVAVLNTDGGTARMRGWTAPGRADVAAAARQLTLPLLSPLGAAAFDTSMQYAFDSDHAPFVRLGIPALDLNPDDGPYDEVHHNAADTLDRVDRRNLNVGAAVVAITAYAVADSPQRLAPHIPPHPAPADRGPRSQNGVH
jgi:Iap family predicted aminopeptidase